ncbi:hypothetical protein BO82DRAFT_367428 [Aspergillus uvarum CBS 121591]|uniref:CCHC-type domain-containing protein n=1 Tax=Aspergillus uvarum CBS 121591 TaxID=1448315 RepID=A0A319C4C5_9EURO|nr:hypothetical protein BO82DRAFT_367428 [Aspergillus uvarum CBS 121591]PYH78740.1 hypothetical protein BO82DRAFT_367428 [Aspergillus uvarum CBS 121591]
MPPFTETRECFQCGETGHLKAVCPQFRSTKIARQAEFVVAVERELSAAPARVSPSSYVGPRAPCPPIGAPPITAAMSGGGGSSSSSSGSRMWRRLRRRIRPPLVPSDPLVPFAIPWPRLPRAAPATPGPPRPRPGPGPGPRCPRVLPGQAAPRIHAGDAPRASSL